MFYIYGYRSTQILQEPITGSCSNCGAHSKIQLYIFQKYAHLFWIPLFPLGKYPAAQCLQCQQVIQKNQMADDVRMAYVNLKSKVGVPAWTFTGLIIVILIALGISYFVHLEHKANRTYLSQPKVGDIYEVKEKDKQYTLYKVVKVEGDLITYQINDFATDGISGLEKLEKEKSENFTQEEQINKSELQKMFEMGNLLDVKRK